MMDLKIKVCGMKYEGNIKAVSALKPNYLGFIFYPPSKRFVGVDFESRYISGISEQIHKTAVFVNATLGEVKEFCAVYGIKTVQLHGRETPDFCDSLKGEGFEVIKAFGLHENFDFEILTPYPAAVDYFLFDTKTDAHGGSGLIFDWKIINDYQLDKPFFLSGGLSMNNLSDVMNINHPHLYGVDLNSKFELKPGLKDVEELKKAFELIRD